MAQGGTWGQMVGMVEELVTSLLGVPRKSFALDFQLEDAEAQKALESARRTRADAQSAHAVADKALQEAARVLSTLSTHRDAGALLGFSHQYIAKLAPKKEPHAQE